MFALALRPVSFAMGAGRFPRATQRGPRSCCFLPGARVLKFQDFEAPAVSPFPLSGDFGHWQKDISIGGTVKKRKGSGKRGTLWVSGFGQPQWRPKGSK